MEDGLWSDTAVEELGDALPRGRLWVDEDVLGGRRNERGRRGGRARFQARCRSGRAEVVMRGGAHRCRRVETSGEKRKGVLMHRGGVGDRRHRCEPRQDDAQVRRVARLRTVAAEQGGVQSGRRAWAVWVLRIPVVQMGCGTRRRRFCW